MLRSIPTEGLDKLEVLRIQGTHSLKIIPSVYHFKNLQEAWLTHSFHCCAFAFPSRHDPESYSKLQENLRRSQELCELRKQQTRTRRSATTLPTFTYSSSATAMDQFL